MLHKNIRPHTANGKKELRASLKWDIMNPFWRSSHWLNHMPASDYNLFTSLKFHMGGKMFSTNEVGNY